MNESDKLFFKELQRKIDELYESKDMLESFCTEIEKSAISLRRMLELMEERAEIEYIEARNRSSFGGDQLFDSSNRAANQ